MRVLCLILVGAASFWVPIVTIDIALKSGSSPLSSFVLVNSIPVITAVGIYAFLVLVLRQVPRSSALLVLLGVYIAAGPSLLLISWGTNPQDHGLLRALGIIFFSMLPPVTWIESGYLMDLPALLLITALFLILAAVSPSRRGGPG